MRVRFLGIGEAFPIYEHNASLLVDDSILLDCGFDVPKQLLKCAGVSPVQVVFITHLHGDHFAGTSALFMMCRQSARQEPMIVVGQRGTEMRVQQNFLTHFENFQDVGFPIEFVEVEPGATWKHGDYIFRFAAGRHTITNLGVRIEDSRGKALVYSGDTEPCQELAALSTGADMLVHDCYSVDTPRSGHTSARDLAQQIEAYGVKKLVPIHFQKNAERKRILRTLENSFSGRVALPEELTEWVL
ncbi:MAG: MBL fold metallo-hydrolase [Dehalococcoidia bacterium]